MRKEEIAGITEDHLTLVEGGPHRLHKDVLRPFLKLRDDARKDGIEITLASSFRNYDRQLLIWNNKASGNRAILDKSGAPLDINLMSPQETLFAILRWSAIPGLSRHHWGTDLDIYDANTMPKDYSLQLIPDEYQKGGIFEAMSSWLDSEMANNRTNFFRPYSMDRNGVSPELWHLSYAPVSDKIETELTFDLFIDIVQSSDKLLLKDEIIEHGEEIFERFIANTTKSVY